MLFSRVFRSLDGADLALLPSTGAYYVCRASKQRRGLNKATDRLGEGSEAAATVAETAFA